MTHIKKHIHIIFSLFVIFFLLLFSLHPRGTKAALPSGLITGYEFEEGSGSTTADESANSLTGTLTNGPTWTNGKYGKGIQFDGTNDYIDLGNSSLFNITSAVTISAWMNISNQTTSRVILNKGGANGSYELRGNQSSNATYRFILNGGTNLNGSGSISANTWHHLAATYDGATMKVYVDGVLNNSVAYTSSINITTSSALIGSIGSGLYFQGILDNVRIYNKALSASEVTTDMNTSDAVLPSTPSGLSATAASSTQISLSWTASTDNVAVTGYKIYRGGSFITSVSSTPYLDTGLSPSTNYSYTVSAIDGAGNESSQSSSANTTTLSSDTQAPTVPTNLAATPISSSQINLSWTASTDNVAVSAYRIKRCVGSGCSPSIEIATTSAVSYSDTGLSVSTAYTYSVSAYDAVGNESAATAGVTGTTQSGPDTTPPTLSSGSPSGGLTDGTTQATLSLNSSENATCRYATSSGVSYASMANTFTTTGGTSHSKTLSGLTDGSSYNYYVRCQDTTGNSNTSDFQISFSVLAPGQVQDSIAPVISGVSASTVGINTATIVWTTNEAADSQVEYGTSTYDFLSGFDTSFATNHSIVLFGLRSDSTYNYRAKSKDSAGNLSNSGNFTFTTSKSTGDIDPPIISDISVDTTYSSAIISWTTDEPGTTKVEYGSSTLLGAGSSIIYSASTTRGVILTGKHSVTLKNLQSKTKYNFRALSDDVVDNQGISGNFTFTTDKIPASLVPDPIITKVAVTAVRSSSAKIEWKTNIPATSQIIFGNTAEDLTDGTLEATTLTTTHSVTVTDLAPKTKYFFRAVSRNIAETATSSDVGSFQTPSLEIQQLVDVAHPNALPIGSPGTETAKITAGETVTAVPILPTKGDAEVPEVIFFNFDQNPTRNTSPTIRGRATDRKGVIATVAYSTDLGASWHPASIVTNIGTPDARFSALISNLKDGNYPILWRAKDNSGNIGLSESRTLVVDQLPPGTGANALFLGTQSIVPSGLGVISTIAGIASKIVTTAVGGVIDIKVIAEKTIEPGGEKTSSTFDLSYFKTADLWYGDINIKKPGNYNLKIKATDGTGQSSVRTINPFSVATPGIIIDDRTHNPVQGAEVFVYQYSTEQNNFTLWPGEIYTQDNPQVTKTDGTYRFILPPGKYYLEIKRAGYQTLYTNITEFKSHSIFALSIPIKEKPYIKIGGRKLYIPTFPDFSGASRTTQITEPSITALAEVRSLLNTPAPIFSLPSVKGEPIDLRYLRGKRTVLTVWSTWSPLAQAQVPLIDEAQRDLGEDANFILIALQESEGSIDTYLRRGGYDLRAIVDSEGKFADKYPILTLPQHFFIDRKGIIRDIFVGFLDKEALLEKMRQL